jgi:hypothetical protein
MTVIAGRARLADVADAMRRFKAPWKIGERHFLSENTNP